jgi:hypothetical protein
MLAAVTPVGSVPRDQQTSFEDKERVTDAPEADGSESTEAASSEADGDSGSAARSDGGTRMGPTEGADVQMRANNRVLRHYCLISKSIE